MTIRRRSPFIQVPLPRPTPHPLHPCAANAGARVPRASWLAALPQSNFHWLPSVPTTAEPTYTQPLGSAKPTAVGLGVWVGEGLAVSATGEGLGAATVGVGAVEGDGDAAVVEELHDSARAAARVTMVMHFMSNIIRRTDISGIRFGAA